MAASGFSAPLTGKTVGNYLIGPLRGAGGMGAVYEATHLELGRKVAIKALLPEHAARHEYLQRFLREGKAACQIPHAHVVDVYDVGLHDGSPYMVMELLDGEDLASLLAREGRLSTEHVANIMTPILAAVATAHTHGVVHRDLKPENIFLARERARIVPKVLDFGISRRSEGSVSGSLTGTDAVLGTPHYMSPEQARGQHPVGVRSDQYSLGVVLYECLTGQRPFAGATPYALLHRIVQGDFLPPRQVHPSLPSEVESLLMRAMARHSSRRFASVAEMGQSLLAFASDRTREEFAGELAQSGILVSRPVELPAASPNASGPLALRSTLRGSGSRSSNGRRVRAIALSALAASGPFAQQYLARTTDEATVTQTEHKSFSMAQRQMSFLPPIPTSGHSSVPGAVLGLSLPPSSQSPTGVSLDPEVLTRAATAQLQLWRASSSSADCRQARDLWSALLAHGDPAQASLARTVLAELAGCADGPGAAARPPLSKPQRRPQTQERIRKKLMSQDRDKQAAPTLPPAPGPSLPSDDPVDGFLNLGAH